MSVTVNHYVVLGAKFDPEALTDDDRQNLEAFMDGSSATITECGLNAIVDGMSGEYAVIGKILARSDDDSPLDGVVDALPVPDVILSVYEAIGQNFGGLMGRVALSHQVEFGVWVFSHHR